MALILTRSSCSSPPPPPAPPPPPPPPPPPQFLSAIFKSIRKIIQKFSHVYWTNFLHKPANQASEGLRMKSWLDWEEKRAKGRKKRKTRLLTRIPPMHAQKQLSFPRWTLKSQNCTVTWATIFRCFLLIIRLLVFLRIIHWQPVGLEPGD